MIRKIISIAAGMLILTHSCFATNTEKNTASQPHHAQSHPKQPVHKKNGAVRKSRHKRHAAATHIHTISAIPNDRRDESGLNYKSISHSSFLFASSIGEHLVKLVYKTVDTLRYSVYKLGGTHFDASNGVYIVDCSEYVDNLLQKVHPNAYISLVNYTGTYKPTTLHYYEFFSELSEDSKNHYWSKIENATKLQPGDILVFRNKHHPRNAVAGHIMIVMDKPIAEPEGYLVRVADSAPVGHSEDTREHRVSGIGIGTLLLKINSKTGQPSAYAWKVGSRWVKNVNFAMARPIGMFDSKYG